MFVIPVGCENIGRSDLPGARQHQHSQGQEDKPSDDSTDFKQPRCFLIKPLYSEIKLKVSTKCFYTDSWYKLTEYCEKLNLTLSSTSLRLTVVVYSLRKTFIFNILIVRFWFYWFIRCMPIIIVFISSSERALFNPTIDFKFLCTSSHSVQLYVCMDVGQQHFFAHYRSLKQLKKTFVMSPYRLRRYM